MSGRGAVVNWIPGPAKASLGNSAELSIPEGYRFVGAQDARSLLRAMNNPSPKSLAGILTPLEGTWMIIFEASEPGYVKDTAKDSLDSTAILKAIRERAGQQNQAAGRPGMAVISLVEWEKKPDYDPDRHAIEWAVRAQSGPNTIVNHVVRLFGRKAMVDGIAVQSPQVSSSIPLREMMQHVAFKPGQAYTDYQAGDKLAALSLTELITSDDPLGEKPKTAEKRPLVLILASCCALVCFVGLGVGVYAWRRTIRSQKVMMARFHLDKPATSQPFRPKTTVVVTPHQNGTAEDEKQTPPLPNPATQSRVNGKRNGHYSSRRKRVFNYQKYYADLMLQVSDQAYDRIKLPNQRNGLDATKSNGSSGESARSATPSTNLDLIASQMNLIEEQQRLIREQTKLIEEKTKLIVEKNQLLEKQTELFGNGSY